MKILITGMAGFIGYHLTRTLCAARPEVELVGLDNLNEYYDVNLKFARLKELGFEREQAVSGQVVSSMTNPNCRFVKMALQDTEDVKRLFQVEGFTHVVNLAAQAGVRYSLEKPYSYIDSNVTGFLSILEACRAYPVRHLVYASSSSVYGLNTDMPFAETDRVEKPASLYAATKRMNEAMAYTYAHLFQIPSSGLRFFTVYGAYGRPDMSYFTFTQKILRDDPIQLFNHGDMMRDFTYVQDVVEGVIELLEAPPVTVPPTEIYNIGNNQPVRLEAYVEALENALGKRATREYLPMQAGDVPATYASTDRLMGVTSFKPDTDLREGIREFVRWYKEYYGIGD